MGFIPDLADEGRFESGSRGSGFGPSMFFWKLLACVAGGIRELASDGGAAILPRGLGILRASKPRVKFNQTLHQSSHCIATRVHCFATKTKALAREIPPATQARKLFDSIAIKRGASDNVSFYSEGVQSR